MDVSQSVPGASQKETEQYIEQAIATGKEHPDDRIGIVTVAKDALFRRSRANLPAC